MKKLLLSIIALAVFISVKAQWVDNPSTNTFLANTSDDAGEIYTATNRITGDTYVQWTSFVGGNGWSPNIQRINFEGEPQWGDNGIHIAGHQFASYSEGYAMATTTDGGVVSCFAAADDHSYAVKISPDGTFPWGEQGVQLFGGLGFSRIEVIATDDNGIWVLGSNYTQLYLQYVNETAGPVVTISDNGGQSCMFGQLTLSNDNRVFVTYEKLGSGFYTDKEIFVAGYNTDGTQFSPETRLMSTQAFQSTYIHYAISDGIGGGYAYIWHPGIGASFNVYVFHFNADGISTMPDLIGTPVHSTDPNSLYISADATVDPISHDIILVYEQTDAAYQSQCKVWINRITSTGYKVWDDGYLVLDNGTIPCGGYRIDAFEYGDGFSVIYHKGLAQNSMQSTVEAKGYDMNHNEIWSNTLCSNPYNKNSDDNTPGYYAGQNISVWVNSETGGLYGQNIGENGEMGEITPPTPPTPCYPPTDFQGEAYYNPETDVNAAIISWTAPEMQPLHYNLYCENLKELIEIDGQNTSYYLELEPGDFTFKLTAVYEDCESDFALTSNGNDYVLVEILSHESVAEVEFEEIVKIIEVYNVNGQRVNGTDIQELNQGVYIIKGVTECGKMVMKKIIR